MTLHLTRTDHDSEPVTGRPAAGPPLPEPGRRRPRWARPALIALLLATAVLYAWNLSVNGYANSFYSAAAQAGSQSWKALFYGSSDASNFITVDKPPASLWLMALSVRIFGLNSWAILMPQVLMGVATVGTVHATVRRRFSEAGGLIAGAVLALTPVAVLMFRFNNPDALLALLLAVATYAMVRAQEDGRTRWLVLAGSLVGLAFLTKTLQAFLVLPVFFAVHAACGPHRLRKRLLQLLYGTLALVVTGGWWVAVVELVPASMRPYIGGSQDNSFLSLTFGYNGFGRLTGDETGSVGGGGNSGGNWGATGLTRLFNSEIGGQISWFIPAALILLVLGLWLTRRAPRTDATRAAWLLWGGTLLFTGITFSFMSGIFHAYYTVALAPSIAALVGMGAHAAWQERRRISVSWAVALAMTVSAVWAFVLLNRTPSFHPWLKWAVAVVGLLAAAGTVAYPHLKETLHTRRLLLAGSLAALVALLAGPAAYAADTVTTSHTGSLPTAGPSGQGGFGGGRMGGGPGGFGGFGGQMPGGSTQQGQGTPGGSNSTGGAGTFPGLPGGPNFQGGTGTQGGTGSQGGRTGGGGGMGGLINGTTVSSQLLAALKENASSYTWVLATVGSQNAASYQLASGSPVMAIGGFNGTDPAPSLSQFKQYVAEGKIHYFIAGGSMDMGGGSSSGSVSSQITAWVKANYSSTTIGGTTVYDLTSSTSSPSTSSSSN